jgi:1-phosphatidylinositol phosphodiesterase
MKNISTQNWMSALDETITLDKLSIPGTHDSGTEKTGKGAGHTQNFDIRTQLDDGIRFLDIRVKNKGKNEKDPLQIYHGSLNCEISYGDVLNDCKKFLELNPSEIIIMLMNAASDGDKNIEEGFDKYVSNPSYHDLFCLKTVPPNLSKLRGKVVLFRRFLSKKSSENGVDLSKGWKDNATFDLSTPQGVKFYIEDNYKEHDTHEKLKDVKSTIVKATSNPNDGVMYITYNSISQGSHTPYQYAWGGGLGKVDPMMNPGLEDFLKTQQDGKRLGTVMLDFYNNETGKINKRNVELIIDSNEGVQLSR